MASTNWIHVSDTLDRRRWKRELISCCYLGKVFLVLRFRNSYNWSTSVNYFGKNAFHPTLIAAKTYVEIHREKGSRWAIEEYPALVVSGSSHCLCLASAELGEQFNSFQEIRLRHKGLSQIASTLLKLTTSEIFVYRTALNAVSPLVSPLTRYVSRAYSGDVELSWREEGRPYVLLSNIFDLEKKIWEAL